MTNDLRETKVNALKRVMVKLSNEIILLENNELLSLSSQEVHCLDGESCDKYFQLKREYRETKEELFYIETEMISLKMHLRD